MFKYGDKVQVTGSDFHECKPTGLVLDTRFMNGGMEFLVRMDFGAFDKWLKQHYLTKIEDKNE